MVSARVILLFIGGHARAAAPCVLVVFPAILSSEHVADSCGVAIVRAGNGCLLLLARCGRRGHC